MGPEERAHLSHVRVRETDSGLVARCLELCGRHHSAAIGVDPAQIFENCFPLIGDLGLDILPAELDEVLGKLRILQPRRARHRGSCLGRVQGRLCCLVAGPVAWCGCSSSLAIAAAYSRRHARLRRPQFVNLLERGEPPLGDVPRCVDSPMTPAVAGLRQPLHQSVLLEYAPRAGIVGQSRGQRLPQVGAGAVPALSLRQLNQAVLGEVALLATARGAWPSQAPLLGRSAPQRRHRGLQVLDVLGLTPHLRVPTIRICPLFESGELRLALTVSWLVGCVAVSLRAE